MVSILVGAVVNIVLDPVMIFGWFGLPAMGIAGAAYAAVIAQIAAAADRQLYHCSVTGSISAAFRMAVIFIGQCVPGVAGIPNHGNTPVFIGAFMVRKTYKKQIAAI